MPPDAVSRRFVLLASLAGWTGAHGAERPPETLVKAALVHKFASFVEWPAGTFPQPDSPLRIGVVGDEGMVRDLVQLATERTRDGRPVVVIPLSPSEPLPLLHVLYIRSSTRAELADVLQRTPPGVLTVSDFQGEWLRGSVISFINEGDRIRFGVSPSTAGRQRLKISERLLGVAQILG